MEKQTEVFWRLEFIFISMLWKMTFLLWIRSPGPSQIYKLTTTVNDCWFQNVFRKQRTLQGRIHQKTGKIQNRSRGQYPDLVLRAGRISGRNILQNCQTIQKSIGIISQTIRVDLEATVHFQQKLDIIIAISLSSICIT